MDDFPAVENNDHIIRSLVNHIRIVKFTVSELERSRQASEEELKELLNHPDIEGSKSYKFEDDTIKITTGLNHTLDKKKYIELKSMINSKFDPVKEVVKLELNKKTLRDCAEFGTPEEIYLQSQFIISTPKKLHISIESPKNEKSSYPDFNGVDASSVSAPSINNN